MWGDSSRTCATTVKHLPPAEDVSEVLVCYALGVYETQSNP
jgi:hypothetical protein